MIWLMKPRTNNPKMGTEMASMVDNITVTSCGKEKNVFRSASGFDATLFKNLEKK